MDLENMRSTWEQMNQRLNSLEVEVYQMKIASKETSQQRLVKQYRVLTIVGLAFGLTSWTFLKVLTTDTYFLLAFSAFFLIAAAMDLCLMHKVDAINVAEMPVSQVADQARQCRSLHHLFQLIISPLAIALITWLAFLIDSEYIRISMLCGMVVGLALGLKIYLGMMRNYKELMKKAMSISIVFIMGLTVLL